MADSCRAKFDAIENNLSQDMKNAIAMATNKKIAICERLDEFYLPDTIDNYRYNLLRRSPEKYNKSLNIYLPIESDDFNIFQLITEKTLTANGLKSISKEQIQSIYDLVTHNYKVDPFYEYIKTLVWDGRPRLRRWFIDGLGAHIPSLPEDKSTYLIEEATQAWFMGAVKRSMEPHKCEIVPILMSKDQGLGKGTFVQYTSMYGIEPSWYRQTSCGIDDPRRFFESIAGAKIIEWGEAQQLKKRDSVEEMKAFISQEIDTYREPYAHTSTSFHRRWVTIITTNESSLFSDTTGNRRFIPFICDGSKAKKHIKKDMLSDPECIYEVQQLWAEAMVLERQGCKAYMPADAEKLARIPQKDFMKGNDFIDAVYSELDKNYPDVGTFLTVEDIREIMNNKYATFPDMKGRPISVTSIAEYHDEWVYGPGRVSIFKNGVKIGSECKKGIKRVKKSSRITYDNLLEYQ